MQNRNINVESSTLTLPFDKPMLGDVSSPHKAYQIDLDRLDEGYLSDIIMCYANNVNDAKKKLLQEIKYDNWKLKYTDDELTYLNIPVIRRKSDDKILFEGKAVTEIEKNRILYKRERDSLLENILNDVNIKYCYIKKGSYYRPNNCGYTDFKCRAGVYTKQEAVQSAKSCNQLTIIPIDILEHNKMINNEILELSSRLL